jgi:RNA polymerase sigma-70 factor (ECF subfamily)
LSTNALQVTESMPDDRELIAAAARGDADAFTALVEKYQRRVLATAYRYIGEAPTAQDIAQEVFLKVWQKAGQFRRESGFSTWLYRIVVNQCLNYRRKRQSRREVPLEQDFLDDGADPDRELERERKSRLVREALQELPGRQRLALVLSQFDRCPYAQIAEMMGISRSSVESLIFRAKQNLKKRIMPLRERGEI